LPCLAPSLIILPAYYNRPAWFRIWKKSVSRVSEVIACFVLAGSSRLPAWDKYHPGCTILIPGKRVVFIA
jgi:hypothetical protein